MLASSPSCCLLPVALHGCLQCSHRVLNPFRIKEGRPKLFQTPDSNITYKMCTRTIFILPCLLHHCCLCHDFLTAYLPSLLTFIPFSSSYCLLFSYSFILLFFFHPPSIFPSSCLLPSFFPFYPSSFICPCFSLFVSSSIP